MDFYDVPIKTEVIVTVWGESLSSEEAKAMAIKQLLDNSAYCLGLKVKKSIDKEQCK